jgi:hypothetical protein
LTITGNASPDAALDHRVVVAEVDQAGPRGVDAGPPDQELGQPLVEGQRVRVGVGAGVRDAELLEQRRVQRLAQLALLALGGVEDEVGVDGLEALEQRRRRTRDLDLLDLVAGGLDRGGDRVHGLDAVELGLLLGVPDVGEAEVVSERDLHRVST